MKSSVIVLLLLLIFAGVVPFVLPLKDGKPLLEFSWSNIKTPSLPQIPNLPNLNLGADKDEAGREVEIYRWQDAEGNWQFSNIAPSHQDYQTMKVAPDANLIQGEAATVKKEPIAAKTSEKSTTTPSSPLSAVNPHAVNKLLQDSKSIENTLQQRHEEQMKQINRY